MFDVAIASAFDFLGAEYRALFSRAHATPFQHPLWLGRIYACLVPYAGAEPLVVTIRSRDDGRLVAVLPLLRRKKAGLRTIEYADLGVSDYVAPIYAPEDREALVRDVQCSEDIRRALMPFDLIRIVKIRDDGPLFSDVFGPLSGSTMRFSAHAAKLFAPFTEWRAKTLDRQFIRFLDRKRRQLRNKGELSFSRVTEAEDMALAFEKLREFRAVRFESLDGADVLQDPVYYDFYLDIANAGQAEGLSRTHVLSLDGEPIAAHFGLANKGTVCFLLVGFNLTEYRNQSVGLLIVESLAADCIARGDTSLDLTIGDEPYKRKFGTEPTPIWNACQGAGLVGSVASAGIKYGGRAKRFAAALRSSQAGAS